MAIFKITDYISKFDPLKTQVINGKKIYGRKIRAQHALHYIVFGKGRPGEEKPRQPFGPDGDIEYQYVLDLIEKNKAHVFKIVLNFDPKKEDALKDLNIEAITRLVMLEIQERFKKQIDWVAVMQDDHTPLRHVHAMVFGNIFFKQADLDHFIAYTTQQALAQRHKLDLEKTRGLFPALLQKQYERQTPLIGQAGGKAIIYHPTKLCEDCKKPLTKGHWKECEARKQGQELTL